MRSSGQLVTRGCGLPNQFEFTDFTVDGSHWQSKIKNKFKNGSQSSSSLGHTGCSDSYNFNAYKDLISEDQFAVNSQSREQMQ